MNAPPRRRGFDFAVSDFFLPGPARRLVLLFTFGLLFGACFSCGRREKPKTARPNFLIVLVDALRADRLGCYGNPRPTSPFLDRLAERGVLFEQAFSHSSHTKLSVAALFTGLPPPLNGIRKAAEANEILDPEHPVFSDVLSPRFTTLAEKFKAAGYYTSAIFTNPHIMGAMGFGQGFDEYLYVPGVPRAKLVNQLVVDRAGILRGHTPWLLYLHYMDVHSPYRPPEQFARMFTMGLPWAPPVWKDGPAEGEITPAQVEYTKALYDAQIRYWDHEFKKLMEELEARGLLRNTIIVFLSDHGDEFYEHRGFGHGFTVFDEVIHVPLIMAGEGRIPAGIRRKDIAALTDLFPTLAGLAGIEVKDLPLAGRDLFAHGFKNPGLLTRLFSASSRKQNTVYSETFKGRAPCSLRGLKTKVILNRTNNQKEFYSLDLDPAEKTPRNRPKGKEEAELFRKLETLSRAKPLYAGAPPLKLDRNTIKELRALGYIGK